MNKVLSDLLNNKIVADQLGKTVTRAADAKRSVDRNMQFVLSLLNLPSRSDYNRLLAKIETLHGSLTNISLKLDRLLAEKHAAAPAAHAPKKKPARRAARPRKAAAAH